MKLWLSLSLLMLQVLQESSVILFHQFPYQVKSPVTKKVKIPVWIRQWAFNLDDVENCFLHPSNMH